MPFIFIPFIQRGRRENNRFLGSWHRRIIITTSIIFFATFPFLANLPMSEEAFAQEGADCFPGSGTLGHEVVTLINSWRVSQGLSPLAPDPRLQRAAQLHSEDLSANNICSHYGSNGSKFINRFRAQGYLSRSGGEMIGCGISTASELLAALVSSETHRSILLEAHHHIGVGLANNCWTVDVGSAADGPTCTLTKAALVLSPIWWHPFYLLYEVK